jgi:hypothetical protein
MPKSLSAHHAAQALCVWSALAQRLQAVLCHSTVVTAMTTLEWHPA